MKWLERIDPEKALKLGQVIMRVTPWFFAVVWLAEFGLLVAFALSPELTRFLDLGAKHQWVFWVCLWAHLVVAASLLFGIVRGIVIRDRPLAGLCWFASILVMGNFNKILTKEKRLVEHPAQFLLLTVIMGFWVWFLIKILPNRKLFWGLPGLQSEVPE